VLERAGLYRYQSVDVAAGEALHDPLERPRLRAVGPRRVGELGVSRTTCLAEEVRVRVERALEQVCRGVQLEQTLRQRHGMGRRFTAGRQMQRLGARQRRTDRAR
jgi:hypothetical protein